MKIMSDAINKRMTAKFALLLSVMTVLLSSSFWVVPVAAFSAPSIMTRRGSLSFIVARQPLQRGQCLRESAQDNDDEEATADVEPVYETVVKMDDGGSDLTDRFKYKVNALMGVFDPQTGVDDEHQSGNIMNALLKFPVRYSFNCVGRTNDDETTKEDYIEEIKSIVSSLSGDDEGMEIRITPRGKNFTRVTLQVTVESVAIINSVYAALEENDKTVMQY